MRIVRQFQERYGDEWEARVDAALMALCGAIEEFETNSSAMRAYLRRPPIATTGPRHIDKGYGTAEAAGTDDAWLTTGREG